MDKIISPDPYGLKPLWNAILDIYAVYRDICARHGLKHFAIGGTAIGAVRHKGFIPWDDDFDVGMPRPDYEKFLQIIEKELPPHLKFVNWENTKEFGLTFGKIQDVRRELVEATEKECGFALSNGIYMDVFPIDGDAPAGSFRAKLKCLRLKLIASLERFHCHTFAEQTKRGKIGWLLGMMISPLFPCCWTHHACLQKFESLLKKSRFSNATESFITGQGLNHHISIPVAGTWCEMKDVPFESVSISISSRNDDYLRSQFGDYMQLPPENARHPTHSYAIRCPWWLGPTSNHNQSSFISDLPRSLTSAAEKGAP